MDQSNKKRRLALRLYHPIKCPDLPVLTNRRGHGYRASNNQAKVCEQILGAGSKGGALDTTFLMLILADLTFRQWITVIQESITR